VNILQVLSQFEVTGAETFAATLADTQIANGHTVYIISDNFYTPTSATVITHPIGKRDLAQRWKNVEFLRWFIREKRIDVVHAHSRAASWVCYFATRVGTVPLVSSIHGRQHLHFSSKMFSVYGEKRVAVCRSIYDHLNHDLHYPQDVLSLVHNGIDLTKWKFKKHQPPKRKKKVVSFVGRLSGFKGDTLLIIVEKIFPRVFERYPDVEFHIIGGMNEKSKIIPAIERTNAAVGVEFIIAKGFSNNVESIYRESNVIVGSGRVAMEALACGSPVISIGESNYVGIISEETKSEALITNFGDLDARRPIDVERSIRAILSALEHPENISGEWGRNFIEENFEINEVSGQMNIVYTEAIAKKKGINEIPVLAYHHIIGPSLPNATTAAGARFTGLFRSADLFGTKRSGIIPGNERSVTVREFEAQLLFLQRKGFTPMTFTDLKEIVAFKRHLPNRPIILTFGPAAGNFQHAFPLLKKYSFAAVFFLQTNVLPKGDQPFITMNQAKELAANGFEIGSASFSSPKMNLQSDTELEKEILGSKTMLEQKLKLPIHTFAYPNGFVNEKLKRIVKASGYEFAVALDDGRRNIWSDLLKIRRIQIFSAASQFSFWKKTSGRYHWYKYVY